MQILGYRHQRTLAAPAAVSGVGFITGSRVRVRFLPASPDTGITFVRTDLSSHPATPALCERVTGTARRTTIGSAETGVTLVEHVMAALSGLRIDNCLVEIDAPEPPGLDGSAWGFVSALHDAGVMLQPARRPLFGVTEPVVVSKDGATIGLHPPSVESGLGLRVSYILDYGMTAPIPRQAHTLAVTPESFAREIAGCRTFLLESEAHALRAQGIGKHLTPADLLLFGQRGLVQNKLRYADEPARHKVLDLIGDLALTGVDLVGHAVAYRSGHALNVALATRLTESIRRAAAPDLLPARLPRRRRQAA